ncbi:MAG: response regulator [Verrucomicrobiota bacterium]
MIAGTLKILVFESNSVNQKILAMMLKRLDQVPLIAETHQECLNHCSKIQFDLIFIAYDESDSNVQSTVLTIKEQVTELKAPRIILISSMLDKESEAFAYSWGVDECLNRPFQLQQIQSCLQETQAQGDVTVTHTSDDSEPLIDSEQLNEMAGGWDPDFCQILNDYLDDVTNMFKSLETTNVVGNEQEARRIAHSLKGSAANFGMSAFSADMARAEKALAQNMILTSDQLGRSMDLLQRSISAVRQESKR